MISLEGKTNFFEKRVGEYQKSGVMASLQQHPHKDQQQQQQLQNQNQEQEQQSANNKQIKRDDAFRGDSIDF